MGKATITENIGEGLYRIKLSYDTKSLDAAIAKLQKAQGEGRQSIAETRKTASQLRAAKNDARLGMEAVIDLWRRAIISATQNDPPTIPSDGTGAGAEDEQPGKLLKAVNARRDSAGVDSLDRRGALDTAIRGLLTVLAYTGRTEDVNSTPETRAAQAGFAYDPDIGVGCLLAFGLDTAAAVAAQWARVGWKAEILLGADYHECGAAYVYAPRSPYAHLWGMYFAAVGTAVQFKWPDSTAKDAAEETAVTLEKIELPKIEDFAPKRLGEACAAFGKAAAQLRAALSELERLQAEEISRSVEIARLKAEKSSSEVPLYSWNCRYIDDLEVGDAITTGEVPGWRDRIEEERTSTIKGSPVEYEEVNINLIPAGPCGRLRHASAMDADRIFVNLSLEPGHLKWRPMWRYGTVRDGPYYLADDREGLLLTFAQMQSADGLVYPLPGSFEHRARDAYTVAPYGVLGGGVIAPVADKANTVSVSAAQVYMPGSSAANPDTGLVVVRKGEKAAKRIQAKTVVTTTIMASNRTGAVIAVPGDKGLAFNPERGSEGGPVPIPAGMTEVGLVVLISPFSAPITTAEITGALVSPAASGREDCVDVAALAGHWPAVTDLSCARSDERGICVITSLIVTASGALDTVAGSAGDDFSDFRGEDGGPPWIPEGAVELGQVSLDSAADAPIAADEIAQVAGISCERTDIPQWQVDAKAGAVTFASALPAIHAGGARKRVYAKMEQPPCVDVRLEHTEASGPVDARTTRGLGSGMGLDEVFDLKNVPILYPCPEVFEPADEVLVWFQNQDRAQPRVIGFRREPKACSAPSGFLNIENLATTEDLTDTRDFPALHQSQRTKTLCTHAAVPTPKMVDEKPRAFWYDSANPQAAHLATALADKLSRTDIAALATGKYRLYQQARMSLKLQYPAVPVASVHNDISKTRGLWRDRDYYYWLVDIEACSATPTVTFTKIIVNESDIPELRGAVDRGDDDLELVIESRILASATVGTDSHTAPIIAGGGGDWEYPSWKEWSEWDDPDQEFTRAGPLAHGWKFNWDGNKAAVVLIESVTGATHYTNFFQWHIDYRSHVVELTFGKTTDGDGNPVFSAHADTLETSEWKYSHDWSYWMWKSTISQTMPHVISPHPTIDHPPAFDPPNNTPVYCYYVGDNHKNNELKVCKISLELSDGPIDNYDCGNSQYTWFGAGGMRSQTRSHLSGANGRERAEFFSTIDVESGSVRTEMRPTEIPKGEWGAPYPNVTSYVLSDTVVHFVFTESLDCGNETKEIVFGPGLSAYTPAASEFRASGDFRYIRTDTVTTKTARVVIPMLNAESVIFACVDYLSERTERGGVRYDDALWGIKTHHISTSLADGSDGPIYSDFTTGAAWGDPPIPAETYTPEVECSLSSNDKFIVCSRTKKPLEVKYQIHKDACADSVQTVPGYLNAYKSLSESAYAIGMRIMAGVGPEIHAGIDCWEEPGAYGGAPPALEEWRRVREVGNEYPAALTQDSKTAPIGFA